jgi:hypothetical protein
MNEISDKITGADYAPSPSGRVRDQVARYEATGGTGGGEFAASGDLPHHRGCLSVMPAVLPWALPVAEYGHGFGGVPPSASQD